MIGGALSGTEEIKSNCCAKYRQDITRFFTTASSIETSEAAEHHLDGFEANEYKHA